ncbi:MAG: UvrD-helicase domain-containing protein [Chloroflexi bacterium]|nr:UvrD-helicase domain-containing protein [Chloroflexota bacterium]
MTMDLLSDLNPQQRKAVTTGPGPALVLAGPGSGKTRVLTHRLAYLAREMGVPPYRIMAVTFTNKAAREMRSRVEALLGGGVRGLSVGTFHAICARFLRREAEHLPVTRDFVIYDESDQRALVKQALRDLNLDEKKLSPAALLGAIGKAKNELIGPEEYQSTTYFHEVAGRVYARYQSLLIQNNALDFDDLLMGVVQLFRAQPEMLAKYQRQYEHILVDEFQDTNTAQYTLVKHLSSSHRNIFVVGDPDQCFPAGTLIRTPQGQKPIETLQAGELVLAASGRGSTLAAKVSHIGKRPFAGSLVQVVTSSGASFRATPNHIVFARLGLKSGLHYVYIMYRKDKGYRVGIASHARSDGVKPDLQMGLRVRSNQENADKIWVLKVCHTREEAYYWESLYAFKYGIPTTVFHVRGRRMRMAQEQIDQLYREIDTADNARQLFADLEMDFNYPHYTPQGTYRNVVNLRYFGDGRIAAQSPWHAHRVDLWSSDLELADKLETSGYNPRIRSRNNWRIGLNRLHYDDIQLAAQKLSAAAGNAEIVTGAFLTRNGRSPLAPRFNLLPASHLHPTMLVAIEKDGAIIEDEIVEVSRVDCREEVYDLEVDNLHNYIAGEIVVHNSVYRWRGADYRNVRRFQNDFPDALTILLERNYRSTQTILDAAMAVIDRNPDRTRKTLFTERGDGLKVFGHEAYDEAEEAGFVVDTIASLTAIDRARPGDCAVMYRTNAQSRALEEAFLRANLPYKLVGAQRFYGRREIKDLISYLRLTHNPADSVSAARVLNVPPRGIGAKTQEALAATATETGMGWGEALLELVGEGRESPLAGRFGGRAGAALSGFGEMLGGWVAAREGESVLELMDRILADTRYRQYIDDGTEECAGWRWSSGRSAWRNFWRNWRWSPIRTP